MPLTIISADAVKLSADALVNKALPDLSRGDGVNGQIFKAAGAVKLSAECEQLSPLNTGDAAVTSGFNLKAGNVIHTVWPVYNAGDAEESLRLLRLAYGNSLKKAAEYGFGSVVVPLGSGPPPEFPAEDDLRLATDAVREFLRENYLDVTFAARGGRRLSVNPEMRDDIDDFISENFIDLDSPRPAPRRKTGATFKLSRSAKPDYSINPAFENVIYERVVGGVEGAVKRLEESFSDALLRLIKEKGFKKDSEVYTRANIDRRLFSKIRSDRNYAPSKSTALALTVALRLSLDETRELLKKAGFALSRSRKFDIIVEYFISNQKYDIFEINEALFFYDQPLLGSDLG
ncbi:MAG: macro domain-containing protein [Deltaproteobacteria bacterium]|nr:macro domain-containing protein [Deltaproteobacteria bacterium]